jgi:hypothetical protein
MSHQTLGLLKDNPSLGKPASVPDWKALRLLADVAFNAAFFNEIEEKLPLANADVQKHRAAAEDACYKANWALWRNHGFCIQFEGLMFSCKLPIPVNIPHYIPKTS